MDRIVFDDCYWEVAELEAYCREQDVVVDFVFGCYF